MVAEGEPAARITVIKNGARWRISTATSAVRRCVNGPVSVSEVAAYFGTHGVAHHLETIFEAAERLADRPDIVFVLVGDGAERTRLLELQRPRARECGHARAATQSLDA